MAQHSCSDWREHTNDIYRYMWNKIKKLVICVPTTIFIDTHIRTCILYTHTRTCRMHPYSRIFAHKGWPYAMHSSIFDGAMPCMTNAHDQRNEIKISKSAAVDGNDSRESHTIYPYYLCPVSSIVSCALAHIPEHGDNFRIHRLRRETRTSFSQIISGCFFACCVYTYVRTKA